MKRYLSFSFVAYGLSTGLNKGLLLFAIPFLEGKLSLGDYGIWNLCQVVTVVLGPIFSLNGYSSIVRFGVKDPEQGIELFKKYAQYCTYSLLLCCGVGYLRNFDWISLCMLLAVFEGYQFLLLGWYRSQENFKFYLVVSLLKVFAVLITATALKYFTLERLLLGQLIIESVFIMPIFLSILLIKKEMKRAPLKMTYFLKFSFYLIPHGLSLWILSSSDRLLISNILGDIDLGIYSLGYSFSLVLMLVNSGIGQTLPNFIIRDYDYYINSRIKSKLILLYSIAAIFLNATLLFAVNYLKGTISYLESVPKDFYMIVCTAFIGLYFLGIYYFYSNILFYHEKAKWISINTTIVAVTNLILTYFFLYWFGVIGAAIATSISYFFYMVMNFMLARKVEQKVIGDVYSIIPIIVLTVLINFSIYQIFIIYGYSAT